MNKMFLKTMKISTFSKIWGKIFGKKMVVYSEKNLLAIIAKIIIELFRIGIGIDLDLKSNLQKWLGFNRFQFQKFWNWQQPEDEFLKIKPLQMKPLFYLQKALKTTPWGHPTQSLPSCKPKMPNTTANWTSLWHWFDTIWNRSRSFRLNGTNRCVGGQQGMIG